MKKRKDGRYQKKVVVQRNGQSHIKWVYGKTKAEVQRKAEEFEKSVDDIALPAVGTLIDEYEEAAYKRYSTPTAVKYISYLKKWCRDCNLKDAKINTVEPKDVSRYLQQLADSGLSIGTVRGVLTAISNLYAYAAVEHSYKDANPASNVHAPVNARPLQKRKPPEKEDIQRIIDSVDQPFGLFAYLIIYSGLRRSEALALRWEDCHDGHIYVTHRVVFDVHGAPHDTHLAKTAAGVRTVPIFGPLKPYLKHPKSKKGYIFSRDGAPLKEYMFKTEWEKYRISAKISCTPHQLRHAFCTACYESGVDAKVCASWMGHANISTTLNIYTNLSVEQEKQASEKIAKFYGSYGLTKSD